MTEASGLIAIDGGASPADYRRKRRFHEQPRAMLHVLRHESGE